MRVVTNGLLLTEAGRKSDDGVVLFRARVSIETSPHHGCESQVTWRGDVSPYRSVVCDRVLMLVFPYDSGHSDIPPLMAVRVEKRGF